MSCTSATTDVRVGNSVKEFIMGFPKPLHCKPSGRVERMRQGNNNDVRRRNNNNQQGRQGGQGS